MNWFHDQSPTGQKCWWQFMGARGDIATGGALVEILKRRIAAGVDTEERLNLYFQQAASIPIGKRPVTKAWILRAPPGGNPRHAGGTGDL